MERYQIITIFFKHARRIVAVSVSIVAVVAVLTFYEDPVYEASSSLIVRAWKEDVIALRLHHDNTRPIPLTMEEMINAEINVLTSRGPAERVIRAVGAGKIYPEITRDPKGERDAFSGAVLAFQKSINAKRVHKSNIIVVSFQHRDPEMAAHCLNLLLDAFNEQRTSVQNPSRSQFIGSQLASVRDNLERSERALQDYQHRHKAFSIEEKRALLLEQRTRFDSAYKMAAEKVAQLEAKIEAMKVQQASLASKTGGYANNGRDAVFIDTKGKLMDLQLKEQELRRKYSESNKLVTDARKSQDIVTDVIKEEERNFAEAVKTDNPVYQRVHTDLLKAQADLTSKTAEIEEMQKQLRQLDVEISVLNGKEYAIKDLRRRVALNENAYTAYSDSFEESRIRDAMNKRDLSGICVVERAKVPVTPVKPQILLNMVLGVLLGLICGMISAYLSEVLNETFPDPESVEKTLGTPVLLTVSEKVD